MKQKIKVDSGPKFVGDFVEVRLRNSTQVFSASRKIWGLTKRNHLLTSSTVALLNFPLTPVIAADEMGLLLHL